LPSVIVIFFAVGARLVFRISGGRCGHSRHGIRPFLLQHYFFVGGCRCAIIPPRFVVVFVQNRSTDHNTRFLSLRGQCCIVPSHMLAALDYFAERLNRSARLTGFDCTDRLGLVRRSCGSGRVEI
jgi:hypothetical protein